MDLFKNDAVSGFVNTDFDFDYFKSLKEIKIPELKPVEDLHKYIKEKFPHMQCCVYGGWGYGKDHTIFSGMYPSLFKFELQRCFLEVDGKVFDGKQYDFMNIESFSLGEGFKSGSVGFYVAVMEHKTHEKLLKLYDEKNGFEGNSKEFLSYLRRIKNACRVYKRHLFWEMKNKNYPARPHC